MKVKDISSFFSQPGSSRARSEPVEQVVDVPSRPTKKGGSKKSKGKDDRLNVSIEKSDEESDHEDPLPKKARSKRDQGNGKAGKSRKPVVIEESDEEDNDNEEPLPKSVRKRLSDEAKDTKKKGKDKPQQDKKRKARVLSESDEEDDFKPSTQQKSKPSNEKPATKLAKVEKPVQPKKEEKQVNPADFFSGAPVKREVKDKKAESKKTASPERKKEDKSSPVKVEKSQTPPKSKEYNGDRGSPQKPVTSIIEPRKLKMETPTPEKVEKMKASSSKSSDKKQEKKTPEKQEPEFKVPTPVTNERFKSRTKGQSKAKSSDVEDDDDEEDFDPKKKANKAKATTSGKAAKSKSSGKSSAKDSTGDDDEDKKKKEMTPEQKENFKKFLAKKDMKPPNLGMKEIPVGAPHCLQDQAFVISGVLDSLERDDCKALIEKYGGRVTGSVSGKTNYLIIGDDPGKSKIEKAEKLKVPQIVEDDLLDMIRRSNPNGQSQDSGLPNTDYLSADESEQLQGEYDADASLFSSPSKKADEKGRRSKSRTPKKSEPESSESATRRESPRKKSTIDEVLDTKPSTKEFSQPKASASSSASSISSVSSNQSEPVLMWVDKYKPKTLKNVVGQAPDTSNAKKLCRWLQNWFKYFGSSQDKPKASWPGLKDPEGKTFKAALLSGPPGIGKTTSAHLAVKEVGYDYFELNASDTRNKRGLHENVADALSSKSLVFGRTNEEMTRRHVLIMDEVDGMSGNEDRGGVQELIALIKSSRVPVICICNDRNHQKIRSLANYCYDLRFNKPTFEQLKSFVMSICFKEKIKIPQEKVRQLIISTDNDVRQILHQLELIGKESNEGHTDQTDQAYNPRKDLRFGPWEVVRKVFLKSEQEKMTIHDKTGLFFQDYNIGPLFVQENYLRFTPASAGSNRYKYMDALAKSAASIADGDLVETVIRRSQNWGLLPVQAVFSSYIPGELMSAKHVGSVEFPQWLGKNSNKNKRQRLLQNLHTHLHLHVSGSLEALNMDYLPYLRRAITNPLIEGDHGGAAKVMEGYTLIRDDVEAINDLSLWPGCKDPMEKVETRVKSAFTRLVNKEILPYSTVKPVKGRGRGGGGGSAEDELEALAEEGEGAPPEEEEEDDTVEKDAMVKVRARKAGSSKAAAGSSSNAKGGKGKKRKNDDSDDDDEDDYKSSSKGSKASKSKPPSKSRKGK